MSLAISIVVKQGLSSEKFRKFSNQSKHFFKKSHFHILLNIVNFIIECLAWTTRARVKKKPVQFYMPIWNSDINYFLTFIGTDQAFEMWSRWDQGKQRNKDPYTPPLQNKRFFCFLFNKGICLYTLLYVFVYLSVDYRSMKKGILCIGPYSGRDVYKILLCTHTNT